MTARRYLVAALSTALVIASAAPAIANSDNARRPVERTTLELSSEAVPLLGTPWQNDCVFAAIDMGAAGDVTLIQPAGGKDLVMKVRASNLQVGTYKVYRDPDGYPPLGPFPHDLLGSFEVTPEDDGHGKFSLTFDAGSLAPDEFGDPDVYTWAIWVNADPVVYPDPVGECVNKTVLRSTENFTFTLGD